MSVAPLQEEAGETWSRVAWIGCGLVVACLTYVALTIQVEYWDTFEYLNNARRMAGWVEPAYSILRSPFPALLYWPFFLFERWTGAEGFGFRAVHLVSVASVAGLLWCFYRLARFDLPNLPAAVATLLLAINPLILHYGPTSRDDVLATLMTTAAFYAYLAAIRSGRIWIFAATGLLTGAAMATSVSCRPSVRERRPSPMTRFHLETSDSTRARQPYPEARCQPMRPRSAMTCRCRSRCVGAVPTVSLGTAFERGGTTTTASGCRAATSA